MVDKSEHSVKPCYYNDQSSHIFSFITRRRVKVISFYLCFQNAIGCQIGITPEVALIGTMFYKGNVDGYCYRWKMPIVSIDKNMRITNWSEQICLC